MQTIGMAAVGGEVDLSFGVSSALLKRLDARRSNHNNRSPKLQSSKAQLRSIDGAAFPPAPHCQGTARRTELRGSVHPPPVGIVPGEAPTFPRHHVSRRPFSVCLTVP